MIISKYGKSYDTADGSEQHHDSLRRAGDGPEPIQTSVGQSAEPTSAGAANSQSVDGGGALQVQPPVSSLEFTAKPIWSVLSLRDLNRAIRLEEWPGNPAHLRRQADDAGRRRFQAIERETEQTAARSRTERNRYRNVWENT